MKKFIFLLLATFVTSIGLSTDLRNISEIKQIALDKLICESQVQHKPRKIDNKELLVVKQLEAVTIVADENSGFVVVSNDKMQNPIVGYSMTKYNEHSLPDGFLWWLDAVNASMASNITAKRVTIPSRLKNSVAPLIKTKWGQGGPYNNLCPEVDGKHCLTGCVATAMAQICYFHHFPEHGYGDNFYKATINGTETTIEKDFSNVYFDYDHMLDSYHKVSYSEQEANAVAVLMEACGKAADMGYGINSSGTSCGFMPAAMTLHLGFSFAIEFFRNTNGMWALNDDATWMNIIFSNISRGLPLYYQGGSHGFIIDGYDEEGKVHINWGWDGDYDGYFSIANLVVNGADFNSGQRMVTEMRPANYKELVYTVNVTEAGTLSSLIDEEEVLFSDRLKVSGNLNTYDFICLRNLIMKAKLIDLDLSDATIVSGEWVETSNKPGTYKFYVQTRDNEFPSMIFFQAIHLGGIDLPRTINTIGYSAFQNNDLKKIFIPASLTNISPDAFVYNDHLHTIEVDPANPVYDSRNNCNGIMLTATNTLFRGCQNTTIPEGTTTIGEHAFQGCIWMKKIKWPTTLTTIGNSAFDGCTRLIELNIPEGVKTIGNLAFQAVGEKIKEIKLPSTVETIGDRAFQGISSLISFKLPASVKTIGNNIVANCRSMTSLTVDKENTIFDSRDDCNGIIKTADNELVAGCKVTDIPKNVQKIGNYAFYMTMFKTMTIPEWIVSVGDYAFAECYELESITIPNSVKTLGQSAFYGCNVLEAIAIPDGISTIMRTALNGNRSLKTVVIGSGINTIEDYSLSYCPQLADVYCYAEEVPAIAEKVFEGSPIEKATLHVPAASLNAYKTASLWRNFGNVVALTEGDPSPTGIETIEFNTNIHNENERINAKIYNIHGQRIEKPAKGLYIVNGKKIVIK